MHKWKPKQRQQQPTTWKSSPRRRNERTCTSSSVNLLMYSTCLSPLYSLPTFNINELFFVPVVRGGRATIIIVITAINNKILYQLSILALPGDDTPRDSAIVYRTTYLSTETPPSYEMRRREFCTTAISSAVTWPCRQSKIAYGLKYKRDRFAALRHAGCGPIVP